MKYCHACCGRPVIGQAVPNIWMCNFCRQTCDIKDTVLTFFLTALLLDTYPGQKTQLYATCSGQAAREILQADPEDFCSLSEVSRVVEMIYIFNLRCLSLKSCKWYCNIETIPRRPCPCLRRRYSVPECCSSCPGALGSVT